MHSIFRNLYKSGKGTILTLPDIFETFSRLLTKDDRDVPGEFMLKESQNLNKSKEKNVVALCGDAGQ